MKLYVDSADLSIITPLLGTGAFYGVTTNPLLLRDAGVTPSALPDFVARVTDLGAREVFLQSWGEDASDLFLRGRRLSLAGSDVVVKLPATKVGFRAAAKLVDEGIPTCITAVFASPQAILAASLGAAYVAPYLGRMNDAGRNGHAVIAEMAEALERTRPVGTGTAPVERSWGPRSRPTAILAASIRGADDVVQLARNGVSHITLSPAVAEALFADPLTEAATRAFEAAATDLETCEGQQS